METSSYFVRPVVGRNHVAPALAGKERLPILLPRRLLRYIAPELVGMGKWGCDLEQTKPSLSRRVTSVNMEQIWAPWRLAYVQEADRAKPAPEEPLQLPAGADPKCFLCQAAADPVLKRRWVVHRDELTVTVLNRYPYNNGHLLVAPRCHRGRLESLSPQQRAALTEQIVRMLRLLEQTIEPQGFNVGLNLGHAAGAGVPDHLHWHIVPRWSGDTNFMPSIAAVKVIPQSLDNLWEALVAQLDGPTNREESA